VNLAKKPMRQENKKHIFAAMSNHALVLVHGYPFDHTLWNQVRELLSSNLEVLAPDLRGFGRQPLGEEEPALEIMADDLAALLDQHQIQRAVLAGMSMGGYVSLAFAERHPEQLAGLGLISSQAAADSGDARAARRAMIEKIRVEGPAAAAQAAIPKLFAPQNLSRTELTKFPADGAERAGADGLSWALEAMARRPDRTTILQSLRVPLLVVHGATDQFIPAARAREMAGLAADGKYVEIAGAGHATPLEAPEAVAEALMELVERSVQAHRSTR
jgi:pimeloyl-ACP methyl ester carboxylesterase